MQYLHIVENGRIVLSFLAEYIDPVVEQPESEDSTHILHLPQTVFLRLWKALSKKRKH